MLSAGTGNLSVGVEVLVGKLKKLKGLKRAPTPTLEDVLLEDLGDAFAGLRARHEAAGGSLTKVQLPDGTTLDIMIPANGEVNWEERLSDIYEACQTAVNWSTPDGADPDAYHEQHFSSVVAKVLRHDGWVLSSKTLKTPAWMSPHVEVRLELLGSDQNWVSDVLSRR